MHAKSRRMNIQLHFVLHAILILIFLYHAPKFIDSLQPPEEGIPRCGLPPSSLRSGGPESFDKATNAIKKFEACENDFIRRPREKTYINALEQSSRAMKHLWQLQRWMSNDVLAEARLRYFMDGLQNEMSSSLNAMRQQLPEDKGLHLYPSILSSEIPFPANSAS
jgi:hypothetical protein